MKAHHIPARCPECRLEAQVASWDPLYDEPPRCKACGCKLVTDVNLRIKQLPDHLPTLADPEQKQKPRRIY